MVAAVVWLHDPILSVVAVLVALALVAWRWGRFDRGALSGLVALESELRRVHRAVRRQVFTEAAIGATLTLGLVLVVGAVHPGLPTEGLHAAQGWVARVADPAAPSPAGPFAPSAALFGFALALLLFDAWSYLIPLGNDRHHWLETMAWLHRPRKNQQPCEKHTCDALAYCTNAEAVTMTIRGRTTLTVPLTLFWYDLLLLVNRHHQELLSERDRQTVRRRTLERVYAACEELGTGLLFASRIRAAFGGAWVVFLSATLVYLAAAFGFACFVGILVARPV